MKVCLAVDNSPASENAFDCKFILNPYYHNQLDRAFLDYLQTIHKKRNSILVVHGNNNTVLTH